jgi:NitT/TauT family transport system substrate-binding protein
MEETPFIEELTEEGFSRRGLLKRGAVAGVGMTALAGLTVEAAGARSSVEAAGATRSALDTVRWVSPRGTLEVMDDYNLLIPMVMGYYKTLNINAKLSPGDASGNLPLIAVGQMDMGYASPGVFTSSVDAGVPVFSIWEQYPAQVFDFVLSAKSKLTHPRQLRGKTIAIHNIGWKSIVDPMLAEVGVNPKTVKYREFGGQWVQAVSLGLADAGLAWEGLRAQLLGLGYFGSGTGELKFLIGTKWGSKGPSNSYQVRKDDLNDPQKVDVYTRFLIGSVMGFEFCRVNPRAAAQITYEQYPGLQKVISPQVAVDSLMQLASGYHTSRRLPPHLYGYHYPAAWTKYLNTVAKLGQTKKRLTLRDVLTNDLVKPVNAKADKARARKDAAKYKLTAAFKKTTLPKGLPL